MTYNKFNVFLPAICLTFLYFIFGKIIFILLNSNSIVTLGMFPPEGISLAFAVYFGKRVLPGVFAGQFLLAYFSGMDIVSSLLISLINMIEAYLGIYLFNKLKIDKSLKTFRDYFLLFDIIVFVLQPFSAVASNSVLYFTHHISSDMYIKSVFSWWFGNVLGQITFTPFLLLIFTRYKELNIVKLLSYGVVYFIFMYIIAIIVGVTNPFVLISFSLIAVIWITIKEGIVFGWFLSIIAAFIASYSIYLNIGAFAGGSLFDNTFNYNFYILIHVFSVLIVGVLFEERKNYEKFLHDRIKEEIQKNNEKQLLLMQENRHAQMGEAISMITHQWKQPLNTLSLLIQSAQLRFSKDKLDKQGFKTFKDNALEQIQYMSETMNDFKNFFKNDKKKQNFSVNDIVRRAVSMVRPIMECDNIELKIDETEYIEYMGYPNNLMQVIINILNNAKDVLNEKNISHKTVNISVADLGGEIHIKIEDNAGGIPEDIINKIFEPYFSTKDKKGTGLGLYMSKIIIEEQMKGKLDVYNSEKGAVFEIILYK